MSFITRLRGLLDGGTKGLLSKLLIREIQPISGFVIIALVLLYMSIGTGIHSDDYSNLGLVKEGDFFGTLGVVLNIPIFYYSLPALLFDFIQFYFFGYTGILYDVTKALVAVFSIYAAWRFALQYISQNRAFLFAALFILFPLHDATNYWTTGSYILITGALVMLSHVQISNGSTKSGLALGFLGAFWSYASPSLVTGLSIIFLLQRQYRKFIIFIIPEFIYVLYYFAISRLFAIGDFRTKDVSSLSAVLKQFLLQVGTFIDVAFGPSLWLKLYYSIASISLTSMILAIAVIGFVWRLSSLHKATGESLILISSCVVLIVSLLTLSLTGALPQIAFNMGNRVTYFGSMFLAFLVVLSLRSRAVFRVVIPVFVLSIFGLSDHWKDWNVKQNNIIEAIRSNTELKNITGETVYVSGNHYSLLGKISHIEFFSAGYVVNAVFRLALGEDRKFQVASLSKYHYWNEGELIDRKFGDRATAIDMVVIYDSNSNHLIRMPANELNAYIQSMPAVTRHWIQLLDNGPVHRLILFLMPRLKYSFN
jgi:hypothetical protein